MISSSPFISKDVLDKLVSVSTVHFKWESKNKGLNNSTFMPSAKQSHMKNTQKEGTTPTCQNSRGTTNFSPQFEKNLYSPPHVEMRANSAASAREESWLSTLTLRRGLSHILQLERNPEVPVASWKDTEFPTATRDEALFPGSQERGNLRGPLQL